MYFPAPLPSSAEDNAAVQEQARQQVLDHVQVMESRLSKGGPFILGPRFSLADAYLCFWIAYLDRSAVCSGFSAVGRLYALVCGRPGIGPLLKQTEQAAGDHARMQKAAPRGVIR